MRFQHSVVAYGLALACLAHTASAASADEPAKDGKLWVYVGTYTQGASKGIYRLEMDLATGRLTPKGLVAETTNPSFLALHPTHRFLYAVNEVGEPGKQDGAVSAFAIDAASGTLHLLNRQSSGGAGPCHLVVDRRGKHVLVANYGGGSVAVLPIGRDGRLGEATARIQHEGSSVNRQRQEGPHAHSINLDPANRFAFAADLGLDKVLIYRFDADKGTLTPNDPPSVSVAPGSGPRHFTFHPDGRHAYVINELANTVTAFRYDPERGTLQPIQTISTLPAEYKGDTGTAEVQAHPSGKFLYGSNRGQNSIVAYTIAPDTGKLSYVANQGQDVKIPRNFAIDPSGTYAIVANQDANSLVVFRIDRQTGALTPTGNRAEVPVPVCVKMMAPSR
jgi:6-phosphogluconolactonase